jgi:hypothetical protein
MCSRLGRKRGSDLARVRLRCRALLVWSDVSLAPLTLLSRSQAASVRAVVDSARRSVNIGSLSTTGRHACIPLPSSRLAVTPSMLGRLRWGVPFFQPGCASS